MAQPADVRRRNQPKQVHDFVSLPRHRASRGCHRAIDENSELQAVCPSLHGKIKSKREEHHRGFLMGKHCLSQSQGNTGRAGVDEDFAGFRERNRRTS